ncbi:MarC family protein [Roseivirga pacifica]|uniref:MarC family protein n=1 Tax=Roseivirga pacifica TaxID=1267423 RepID=UPI00227A442B|nr:MarC family protein [Roseivirga pacifica]
MHDYVTSLFTTFMAFFAIMNPFANLPVFLSLTKKTSKEKRNEIASKACINAFFIVAVFMFGGNYIFNIFGLTIEALRITGGIIIFYVGFEMLLTQSSKVQSNDTDNIDIGIAISPLAIPILAGPGTIVTAINLTADQPIKHVATVALMFAGICLLTYLTFRSATYFYEKLGENLIQVISKLMGLILAVIGMAMLIGGIKEAFNIG